MSREIQTKTTSGGGPTAEEQRTVFFEHVEVAWPGFLRRRAERLHALDGKGRVTEKVVENSLEDLLTQVLDWSLGEVVYQFGNADMTLVHLGKSVMVLEAKSPQGEFRRRGSLLAALRQARRYANTHAADMIGVCDGKTLYVEDAREGQAQARLLVSLDDKMPNESLRWLSRENIQRRRDDLAADFNPSI